METSEMDDACDCRALLCLSSEAYYSDKNSEMNPNMFLDLAKLITPNFTYNQTAVHDVKAAISITEVKIRCSIHSDSTFVSFPI